MVIADKDELTPTDIAIEAYSRAREPKEIFILAGGHYAGYFGEKFDRNTERQIEFWKKYLLTE